MANTFKQIQTQPWQLAGSGCAIGATSIIVSNFVDIEGANLAMTDFGVKGFGTLEAGNGSQEESITWSGVTQNGDGTATLTGVKTCLFKDPYTETSGVTKSHAGGTNLIYSNTSAFYEQFLRLGDGNTVADVLTFTSPNYPQMDTATPSPTLDAQFATKKYADDLAIAGSPDASTTNKGIVKMSSAPASPTSPVALNNEEVSATSSANKVVKANSSGKIDVGFIDQTANYDFSGVVDGVTSIFGDGSDGDATISVDTTLTTDKFYNNLTVNNAITLKTGGYRIFVKGTLTNNGTIQNSGNAGSAASSAGGTTVAGTLLGGGAGGAGANGDAGKYGGGGGAGGGILFVSAQTIAVQGNMFAKGGNGGNGAGTAGAAGGGSGSAGTSITNAIVSAPGGGGGYNVGQAAGGTITNVRKISERSAYNLIMFIDVANLVALGGGGGGGGGHYNNALGGYGGGGGGGGTVLVIYKILTTSGSVLATGGIRGTFTGTATDNAVNGTDGKIIQLQIV